MRLHLVRRLFQLDKFLKIYCSPSFLDIYKEEDFLCKHIDSTRSITFSLKMDVP